MFSKLDILKDLLIKEIHSKNLRPGDSIPSRNRLKQKYGFSLTTINKAIADLIEEGYLSSVKGSSTRVLAREPVTSPQCIYAISGYNDSNLEAVREPLYSYNNISCQFVGVREEDVMLKFDAICKAGSVVIWISPNFKSILVMEHFERYNIPQIIINRDYEGFNFVTTDNRKSIQKGLSWLMIEAGRDIAFVAPEPSTKTSYIYPRIYSFYEAALELGAKLSASMIFSHTQQDFPATANELGHKLFLGADRPRAIFVLNSKLAVLLVTFARAHNIIPGRDYHMLVFDYIEELANTPGICMMRQQFDLMYQEIYRWLESYKDNRKQPEVIRKYIETKLVIPQE